MFQNRNIIVVGLARDVAFHLEKEIFRLEKQLKNLFDSIEFYLVESDSKDTTTNILSKLKMNKPNFDYISLDKLEKVFPNRIQRLTFCRNIYVTKIREINKAKKFDYVLVNDFDIKNKKLDLFPLNNYLNKESWSGLFVNQKGFYYDIFALRCKNWSETDCYEDYRSLSCTLGGEKAKQIAIWSKMRKIPKKSSEIEVDSAFGGLAVYKTENFMQFNYDDSTNKFKSSEHVHFNLRIRNNSGKLLIVPALINFSWNPHNLSKFKVIRTIDSLSKYGFFKRIRRFLRNRLA